jgi:hypothetical protein
MANKGGHYTGGRGVRLKVVRRRPTPSAIFAEITKYIRHYRRISLRSRSVAFTSVRGYE